MDRRRSLASIAASLLIAGCGARSSVLEPGSGLADDGAGGSSATSSPATWPDGPAPSTPVVVAPNGGPRWLGVLALGDRFAIAWVESTGGLTAGDLWLATARREGVGVVGSSPLRVGKLGMAGAARLARVGDGIGLLFADEHGALHLARFDRDGAPLDDAPTLIPSTTVSWPMAARAEGDHVDVVWNDYRPPGVVAYRRLRLDGQPVGPETVLDVLPMAADLGASLGAGVYPVGETHRLGLVTFDPAGATPPAARVVDAAWGGYSNAISLDASGAVDVAVAGRTGARVGRWGGGAEVVERARLDQGFAIALARRPDGALAVMASDAEITAHEILQTRITVRALGAGDAGPVGGASTIEAPPVEGHDCLVASAFDAGDADYGVAWANQCDVDGAGPALRFSLIPWR